MDPYTLAVRSRAVISDHVMYDRVDRSYVNTNRINRHSVQWSSGTICICLFTQFSSKSEFSNRHHCFVLKARPYTQR